MDFFESPRVMYLVAVALPAIVIPSFVFRMSYLAAKARNYREAMLARAVHAKELLTANETEFYGRLQEAAKPLGLTVVTQVAMGALLDTSLPKESPFYWEVRKLFSQKIIDFVVFRKEQGKVRVLAVIELDDRTHDPEKDRKRDALMAKAGFRTIRWDSRSKPDVGAIRQKFAALVPNA